MNWSSYHTLAETAATIGYELEGDGRADMARDWFAEAADAELSALSQCPDCKRRTLGITAVSAAALLAKAGRRSEAIDVATRYSADSRLPAEYRGQLCEIAEQLQRRN